MVEQKGIPAGNVHHGRVANDRFHLRQSHQLRIDGGDTRQATESFFGIFLIGTAQRGRRNISDDRIIFILQVRTGGLQDIMDIILAWGGK